MEKTKKLFNSKNLTICVAFLIMLQPLIDMDYIIYPFLNKIGIPRLSTIIRFVIIPLLIIWAFFLKDKNKKKTLIFGIIYGVCLAVFFYLHCKQSARLYESLGFTTNFYFSIYQELTYVLTLVIPYGLIYAIYHIKFDEKWVKRIVVTTSAIISIPIFIGDLFVFGKSTYYGYTVANFFSWFNGIYLDYHPRTLASKFFFNEGNTIGILLFMVLPIMYYFLSKSSSKKEKIGLGVLIFIQSFSMQILATRVATYGAVLIPLIFLVLYIVSIGIGKYIKKNKIQLNKTLIILTLCFGAFFGAILDFTPAVQNQKVDNKNDTALLGNTYASQGMEDALKNAEDLIPGTLEYNNYYIFAFEEYGVRAKYITSVPSMYYIDYYNYKYDPKFWFDVAMLDPYERVSGRQVQTIFMNYKYQNLTTSEKVLGMGYSTFMNGSIVLEQDFKQQIYTLGYLGSVLTTLPWLLLLAIGAVLVLIKWKKLITLENITYAISLGAGIGSAYMSGHTLDQFVTTIFMAFITALLLNRVKDAYIKENEDAKD